MPRVVCNISRSTKLACKICKHHPIRGEDWNKTKPWVTFKIFTQHLIYLVWRRASFFGTLAIKTRKQHGQTLPCYNVFPAYLTCQLLFEAQNCLTTGLLQSKWPTIFTLHQHLNIAHLGCQRLRGVSFSPIKVCAEKWFQLSCSFHGKTQLPGSDLSLWMLHESSWNETWNHFGKSSKITSEIVDLSKSANLSLDAFKQWPNQFAKHQWLPARGALRLPHYLILHGPRANFHAQQPISGFT